MKKVTKLLSIVLTLAMLVSALPVIASADDIVGPAYNKNVYTQNFDSLATGTSKLSAIFTACPTKGWITGLDEATMAYPNTTILAASDVAGLDTAGTRGNVLKLGIVGPTSGEGTAYDAYFRTPYKKGKSWVDSYLANDQNIAQRSKISMDLYLPADSFNKDLNLGIYSGVSYTPGTDGAEGTIADSAKSDTLVSFLATDKNIVIKNSAGEWIRVGTIETDKWNTIEVYIDGANATYDVALNGTVINKSGKLSAGLAGRVVNSVTLGGNRDILDWTVYVDNLKFDITTDAYDYVISKLDFENYNKTDSTALAEDDELYSFSTTTNKVNTVDGIFEVFNLSCADDGSTTSETNYSTLPTAKVVYKDGGKRFALYGVSSNEFVTITGDAFKANNPYYAKYGKMPDKYKLEFDMRVMASPIYMAVKHHGTTTTARDFFAYGGTTKYYSFNGTTRVENIVTWPDATNNWRKFSIYVDSANNKMDVYCQDTYLGTVKTSYLDQGFECLGFKSNEVRGDRKNKILAYMDNITLSVPRVYMDENIHQYLTYTYAADTTDETGAVTAVGQLTGYEYETAFYGNLEADITKTYTILAAEYDSNGALVDLSVKDDCTITGAGEGLYEVELPTGAASKNCQYFFWEGAASSLKPLFAAKTLVK